MTFLDRMLVPGFNGLIEILVLAVLLYYIFLFFQGSRGAQVLSGLVKRRQDEFKLCTEGRR